MLNLYQAGYNKMSEKPKPNIDPIDLDKLLGKSKKPEIPVINLDEIFEKQGINVSDSDTAKSVPILPVINLDEVYEKQGIALPTPKEKPPEKATPTESQKPIITTPKPQPEKKPVIPPTAPQAPAKKETKPIEKPIPIPTVQSSAKKAVKQPEKPQTPTPIVKETPPAVVKPEEPRPEKKPASAPKPKAAPEKPRETKPAAPKTIPEPAIQPPVVQAQPEIKYNQPGTTYAAKEKKPVKEPARPKYSRTAIKVQLRANPTALLEQLLKKLEKDGLTTSDNTFPEVMELLLTQDPAYNQEKKYKLSGPEKSLKWR